MTPYESPESVEAKRRLREIETRLEIKADVRRTLDMTEEGLGRELQETVRRQQHGDKTADVDAALTRLNDFKNSRWQKEKTICEKIDES
jgi:uncharacterized protein with von Willebrand factor type A (vWA) domain